MLIVLILFIASYLAGSISGAIVLARIQGLPDPRTQGSGNAGATNMLRTGGKKNAILVLLFDALKGVVMVLLARVLGLHLSAQAICLLLVMVGHIYPVFFQFKGGKGVATICGGMLALLPTVGGLMILAWIGVLVVTRYASLASIVAVMLAPIGCVVFGYQFLLLFVVLAALLVLFKHRENINRLLEGRESKVNLSW